LHRYALSAPFGSFSHGSWSLSSVAYGDSASENWPGQSSESATLSGGQTVTVTGTFGSGGTLDGYGGASFSNCDTVRDEPKSVPSTKSWPLSAR
jgi:hypothetical protein